MLPPPFLFREFPVVGRNEAVPGVGVSLVSRGDHLLLLGFGQRPRDGSPYAPRKDTPMSLRWRGPLKDPQGRRSRESTDGRTNGRFSRTIGIQRNEGSRRPLSDTFNTFVPVDNSYVPTISRTTFAELGRELDRSLGTSDDANRTTVHRVLNTRADNRSLP